MFELSECARRCSPEQLDEYLQSKKLSALPTGIDGKQTIGDAFIAIVNAAPSDVREEIEVDFQLVQEMTGGAEARLLTERAMQQGLSLPKDFNEMATCDKALWLYMNAPELFIAAMTDCEIEDTKSWVTYRVPLTAKENILGKTTEVGEVVTDHYRRSGRSRYCKTVQIDKENYLGIAAYPLNYARSEEGYDDSGNLVPKKIAPVFEVYFLYVPIPSEDIAYLSVKVKDGGRGGVDTQVLALGFAEKVLGKVLHESDRVKYSLDKLQDLNVTFADTDDADMIDSVKVVNVVIWNPLFPATISLRANSKHGSFNMSDIGECLRRLHIQDLNGFRIVNAELRFQFKKEGRDWKSKGVVSAKINTNKNSSCNLGISKQHMTVRKYLRKWGIEGK